MFLFRKFKIFEKSSKNQQNQIERSFGKTLIARSLFFLQWIALGLSHFGKIISRPRVSHESCFFSRKHDFFGKNE